MQTSINRLRYRLAARSAKRHAKAQALRVLNNPLHRQKPPSFGAKIMRQAYRSQLLFELAL